ncbi:MAG: hypothetical protein HYZ75_18795 [Elusimicrobia bacterium]|nr:hypothetical protein [Elusimicrobiota bacterium]
MRTVLLVVALLSASGPACAAFTGAGAFVKDAAGADRNQFSNTERVTLQARVANTVASVDRIRFTFRILAPTGQEVFRHQGNSVPGSIGNSASQVSGVPVSQFFAGPGLYSFTAEAALDGQTVAQSASFALSSPNILLIYPPNGAREVGDRPVTFRWTASGATRYRVTVGENPSLYNALFSQSTQGAENVLAYPENPADPRLRLSGGQVYYWKVEGLDAAGNVVAQSETPANFSALSAALTRDLAVTEIELTGRTGASMNFSVRVANQGGSSESNISMRMSLGGLPAPNSPLILAALNPGDGAVYTFSTPMPPDQAQSLAIACLDFFDDNVPNNCKSMQVARPAGLGGADPARPLTKDELWEALKQKLTEAGTDMSGYSLVDFGAGLSADDMQALLEQLASGQAQISVDRPVGGVSGAFEDMFANPIAAPDDNLPAEGPEAAAEAGPSGEELLGGLGAALESLGLDLGEYKLRGLDGLSAGDAAALLDQLKRGTARLTLSGPRRDPAGGDGAAPIPEAEVFEGPPPTGLEEEPAETEEGEPKKNTANKGAVRGFAGRSVDSFGPRGARAIIRDAKDFGRLWKRLSAGPAPEIDFEASMVVLVVAGSGRGASRVEFSRVAESQNGLLVAYRLEGAEDAGVRREGGAPFAGVVVRLSGLKGDFQEEGGKEGR